MISSMLSKNKRSRKTADTNRNKTRQPIPRKPKCFRKFILITFSIRNKNGIILIWFHFTNEIVESFTSFIFRSLFFNFITTMDFFLLHNLNGKNNAKQLLG